MQIIDLPPLPTNARYVLHNNECYDWGTFGWALTTQGINVDKYSYFVFMNSSVRGPFVPTYIKVRLPGICSDCPVPLAHLPLFQ